MSHVFGELPRSHERITLPTIWIAFVLSLVLHIAGLAGWVQGLVVPFAEPKLGEQSGTLAIRLVPHTSPPPIEPASPAPAATPSRAPAKAAPRPTPPRAKTPAPAPPVIALQSPAPVAPTVPAAPEATKPAPAEDLAAYIAARRRARGEGPPAAPAQPAESEQERTNRIAAENLGLTSTPTFGNDPERGGGVFQIRSMGYDIGEFAFFGWNKDINRNSLQVIEVRRGSNPNMEIAMARRMIGIIRERSTGDFLWQSRRLNRGVWLSARPADTAELEAFILKELFPDPRPRP